MTRQKFSVACFGGVLAWVLAATLFNDVSWHYIVIGIVVGLVLAPEA